MSMSRTAHSSLNKFRPGKIPQISKANMTVMQQFVQSANIYPTITKGDKQKYEYTHKYSKITSQLPNISQLLNKQTRILESQFKETLIEVSEYAQQLENQLRLRTKEIEKLSFLNKFLEISAVQKEEMIQNLQRQIYELKDQIHEMQMKNKFRPLITKSPDNQQNPHGSTHNIILQQKQSSPAIIALNNEVQHDYLIRTKSRNDQKKQKKSILHSSLFLSLKSAQSLNIISDNSPDIAPGSRRQIDIMGDFQQSDMISQRFGSIVNLQMTDHEALCILNETQAYQYLKERFSDDVISGSKKSKFIREDSDTTKRLEEQSTKELINCTAYLFKLILRLKHVIRATINLDSSLGLNKSLDRIIDLACASLECERSSVFILDQNNGELWSTAAKGTNQIIRMPSYLGVVGHAVQNLEIVNIPNAYIDQRFDKSTDLLSGYITKTILAFPLMDENRCIGVVEGINKLHGQTFNKEDEEFILLISKICSNILQQTVVFDQQYTIYNKLRHTIITSIQLVDLPSLFELIKRGELRIQDMINGQLSRIILYDQKNSIFYFDDHGNQIYCDYGLGVAGRSVQFSERLFFSNLKDHEDYNPKIDIDSDMPGISYPIQHQKLKRPLGCIQITSNQVLESMNKNTKGQCFSKDQEVIGFFSYIIGEHVRKHWNQQGIQMEFSDSNMISISIN